MLKPQKELRVTATAQIPICSTSTKFKHLRHPRQWKRDQTRETITERGLLSEKQSTPEVACTKCSQKSQLQIIRFFPTVETARKVQTIRSTRKRNTNSWAKNHEKQHQKPTNQSRQIKTALIYLLTIHAQTLWKSQQTYSGNTDQNPRGDLDRAKVELDGDGESAETPDQTQAQSFQNLPNLQDIYVYVNAKFSPS